MFQPTGVFDKAPAHNPAQQDCACLFGSPAGDGCLNILPDTSHEGQVKIPRRFRMGIQSRQRGLHFHRVLLKTVSRIRRLFSPDGVPSDRFGQDARHGPPDEHALTAAVDVLILRNRQTIVAAPLFAHLLPAPVRLWFAAFLRYCGNDRLLWFYPRLANPDRAGGTLGLATWRLPGPAVG